LILLLGAALGIAAQSFISQTQATQVVHFESAAPAPAATASADKLSLWGHLSLPDVDGPFPAVVLLHGCAGPQPNHFRWAHMLNRLGYLTLVVDSFGPRSIVRRCTQDPTPDAHADRRLDALGAHAYLASRADVDPDRIGLVGWSQGASVALDMIGRRHETARDGFRSAVAFYPYCMPEAEFSRPALILIGGADDWSPVDRCRQLAIRNRQAGMVKLIVYPRAFHAFDMIEVVEGFGLPGPNGEHWIQFDPRAYQDSMFRMQTFLKQHL
jgi:dienelactone hydrolase